MEVAVTTSCRPRLLRSASSAAATLGEAGHRSSAEEGACCSCIAKSDSPAPVALPPPPRSPLLITTRSTTVTMTVGTTDAVAMNSAVVHTVCTARLRRFKCARGLDIDRGWHARASRGRRSPRRVHGGPGGGEEERAARCSKSRLGAADGPCRRPPTRRGVTALARAACRHRNTRNNFKSVHISK